MSAGDENSPVFNFTSLDFDSMERDLIAFAQSRFPDGKWTDFNETNEGRRLIELVAYATDLLSYAANAWAREAGVTSLTREQNFRNIVKPYSYQVPSASPAHTTLRFTLDGSTTFPFVMPVSIKVSDTGGEYIFQPDAAGSAVSTTYDVAATQGEQISGEAVATSDGSPGQSYELSEPSIIDGTTVILVSATPYTEIDNWTDSGPTSTNYYRTVSDDDVTTITFGDGVYGKIPPIGQSITASYKIGGGVGGNLPIGVITQLIDVPAEVLSVTNITVAEDGGPKPTLQQLKKQFPLLVKANERAVTNQDYATLARTIAGVLDANALDGSAQGGGNPVMLFIVPNGGGSLTAALANQIIVVIRRGDNAKGMAGKRVQAYTAVYVDLIIEVDAYVQPGILQALVVNRVASAYSTRYSLGAVLFGSALDTQDAYNTVDPVERRITGLSKAFLRKFTVRQHYSRYVTKPTTGDGTAEGIFVDSEIIKRREWNIKFVPPVGVIPEYEIRERRLGVVSSISDRSLEDESGGFDVNELISQTPTWYLRPREQDSGELFSIVANTRTSITVSVPSSPGNLSSLFVTCGPGDTYAVERLLPNRGKVYRDNPSVTVTSGNIDVLMNDVVGLTIDDYILVREGSDSAVMQILLITGNTITFSEGLPFTITSAATFDWFWYNTVKSVGFAVVQGSTIFVINDEFYVDTYAAVGDIRLRPENYPKLADEDLTVNGVGGVR